MHALVQRNHLATIRTTKLPKTQVIKFVYAFVLTCPLLYVCILWPLRVSGCFILLNDYDVVALGIKHLLQTV